MLGEQSDLPRLELVWADGAYTGGFREWLEEERGWRVEVPRHRDRQSSGDLRVAGPLSRRFSKDYERLPATAEAMIYGAMSRLMLCRLARAA